jgi:hypothetical protein
MKKYILFLTIIFPMHSLFAMHTNTSCSRSLSRPLNLDQFQQCQALIKKVCPPNPVIPNLKCTQPLLKQNRICHQGQSLANLLMGDISTLQVKQYNNFFIVNNYTIADGQNNYSIITPRGCILNTVIDVRHYDATLMKKYKTAKFLTLNDGEPKVFVNKKKQMISVTVPLKINDTCVACATMGYATVGFYFTNAGDLTQRKVLTFTPAVLHTNSH